MEVHYQIKANLGFFKELIAIWGQIIVYEYLQSICLLSVYQNFHFIDFIEESFLKWSIPVFYAYGISIYTVFYQFPLSFISFNTGDI